MTVVPAPERVERAEDEPFEVSIGTVGSYSSDRWRDRPLRRRKRKIPFGFQLAGSAKEAR